MAQALWKKEPPGKIMRCKTSPFLGINLHSLKHTRSLCETRERSFKWNTSSSRRQCVCFKVHKSHFARADGFGWLVCWLLASLRVTSWLIILYTEEQRSIKTQEPRREHTLLSLSLDNDMHIMMVWLTADWQSAAPQNCSDENANHKKRPVCHSTRVMEEFQFFNQNWLKTISTLFIDAWSEKSTRKKA